MHLQVFRALLGLAELLLLCDGLFLVFSALR
jgi:hypothetical protein